MVEKIYKTSFWVYVGISILFVVGLFAEIYEYGRGYEVLLVLIVDVVALCSLSFIRVVFRKVNKLWKECLAYSLIGLMFFLCVLYIGGIH